MPRELLEDLKKNLFCLGTYSSKELQGGKGRGKGKEEEQGRRGEGKEGRELRKRDLIEGKNVSLLPLHAKWVRAVAQSIWQIG